MIRNYTRYIPDPFILALIGMIFLAWWIPGMGMGDHTPNLGMVIDGGIFMIFFLYGLKLNPEKIRQGMRNWRMHLTIQATTFILFPLLVLPFYPLLKNTPYEMLWTAVFFLAALPSTVSSSVVMVSMAGGNVPGAIFNASISGMIGIRDHPVVDGTLSGRKRCSHGFLPDIPATGHPNHRARDPRITAPPFFCRCGSAKGSNNWPGSTRRSSS